jgi:hypothetical protein
MPQRILRSLTSFGTRKAFSLQVAIRRGTSISGVARQCKMQLMPTSPTVSQIGGTSAGSAILGQFSYGALNDPPDDSNLTSADALRNPFATRVTLVRDFLRLPLLRDTITDSHFAKRDRLGRSLVFPARLMQDG